MAARVLPWLSESILRALPMIERGVREGISRNALQTLLSEAGIGVRRTDLLSAYSAIANQVVQTDALLALRTNLIPPVFRIPEAITRIRRQFSYKVVVTAIDRQSGETVERHVTVSTDRLLPFTEAENLAQGMVQDDTVEGDSTMRRSQYQVTGAAVEGILKGGAEGTIL